MILKNIYKRKDFVKQYEFLGGNEGGTGSGNGFANNAALQDTLLGQILNGMFKSISWLWRKSKENFVINRLKARLSNELLRGVILYCFENNINILSGEKIDAVQKGEEKSQGEKKSQDQAVTGQEEDQTDEQDSVQDTVEDKPAINDFEIIKNDIKDFNLNKSEPKDRIALSKKVFGLSMDYEKVINIKDMDVFQTKIDEMDKFLKDNISNYSNLKPAEQEKLQNIYKNLVLSKYMLDKVEKLKKEKVTESYKLNEELVKAPTSDPRAGSDPKSKKLSTNVTVGSILTKRDKEKYKEHEEELKSSISEINLAEVEKQIDKLGSKKEVSKYVNAENLKTIQLTAANLFLPSKTSLYKKPEIGEKSIEKQKLQNNWNKEISKVYAIFSDIMNISDVDIRREYREDLEGITKPLADRESKKITGEKGHNLMSDNLQNSGALESINSTIPDLATGKFAFVKLTYNGNVYSAMVENVPAISKNKSKRYLLRVFNTFETIDIVNNVYKDNFTDFKIKFTNNNPGCNVFLGFDNPKTGRDRKSALVFYELNNKLYLCKIKKGGGIDGQPIHLDDIDINNINISEYLVYFNLDEIKLFKDNMGDELKNNLGFVNDYQNKIPNFYSKKYETIIKNIFNLLKKQD